MKTIRNFFVVMMCSVTLVGCANNDDKIVANTSEEDAMEMEDSFDERDTGEIDKEETGNVYYSEIEETDNNLDNEINDKVLLYPTQLHEFSEGVAWVEGNVEGTGDNICALINEDGEAVYVEKEDVVYISKCEDGLTYIRVLDGDGNVISKVISKDGSLIFTSNETENAIVLGYGDGMFIVGKEVRGFDVNETQIGVVDKDGQWISNLSADKFVVDGECYINNIKNGKDNTLQYLGEGVFTAHEEDNWLHRVFYNAVENINFELSGYWYLMGDYYNGKLLMYNSNDYGYVGVNYMDKTGNITMITGDVDTDEVGKYSDGLWYYDGKFYNDEGIAVVDISQYQISDDYRYPIFKDGYSVIVLVGADRYHYYTVIDIDGNFMFEPRFLQDAYYKESTGLVYPSDRTSPGELKDGLFSIYENGKWIYYNVFGEKEIEINIEVEKYEVKVMPYDNNVALIYGDSINNYVGRDGEIILETMLIDRKLL